MHAGERAVISECLETFPEILLIKVNLITMQNGDRIEHGTTGKNNEETNYEL